MNQGNISSEPLASERNTEFLTWKNGYSQTPVYEVSSDSQLELSIVIIISGGSFKMAVEGSGAWSSARQTEQPLSGTLLDLVAEVKWRTWQIMC